MEATFNPYAPPQAAVADMAAQEGAAVQPVKVWGAKGRIGRMRYFAYMLSAGFIMNVVMWILMAIFGAVAAVAGMSGSGSSVGFMIALVVLMLLLFVPYMIFYVRATMQRSHDLNLSGWTVLLTFIPLLILYWVFAPGTQGANHYGPPPEANSTGVKVVFWIGMGLMALWLLSIIVMFMMLPSFQG